MYIVFEGPDGSGKTTQMNNLFSDLSMWIGKKHNKITDKEKSLIQLRQPGGTNVGEKIRNIVKSGEVKSNYASFHLFVADHYEFEKQNEKYLKDSITKPYPILLQDRYSPVSGYAYQVSMFGIDYQSYIQNYQRMRYLPNVILIFNVGQAEIKRRLQKRGKLDGFETHPKFSNMISAYKGIRFRCPIEAERFIYIDANGSEQEVYREMITKLSEHLKIQRFKLIVEELKRIKNVLG